MVSNRMKQFREYNNLSAADIATILEITTAEYEAYESGEASPDIDLISKLAVCYKVTVDEFYGYSPRLSLYAKDGDIDSDVDERILKMADLSWDESQLIMYYRQTTNKEALIEELMKSLYKKSDDSTEESPKE